MSLLDDARQLLGIQPLDSDGPYCRICGNELDGYPSWRGHEPDCTWLAMPKIVAALEAAELAEQALNNCAFQDRLERQHSHEEALGALRKALAKS